MTVFLKKESISVFEEEEEEVKDGGMGIEKFWEVIEDIEGYTRFIWSQ